MAWMIIVYFMDVEVPSKYDTYLKRNHYDRTSCGSYVYGCCEIYIDCVKQDYTVVPVLEAKLDPEGGNCMGLGEIIEAINGDSGSSNGNCIINGQCDMVRQFPNGNYDNMSSIYYHTPAVDGHCPTGEDLIEMYMSLGKFYYAKLYWVLIAFILLPINFMLASVSTNPSTVKPAPDYLPGGVERYCSTNEISPQC